MTVHIPAKAALLLATITITAIDGELDAHEVAIINRLDGFTTSEDWDSAIAVWNDTPLEDCIAVVAASLNEKQQRVAMANMFDIAMADGRLDEAENVLLRAYANAFTVSDEDIERIVDVITIKNDKTKF
ncbi:TerB family tellurite resistance protein [Arenicella xantha]|uniref:Tellurite resistance protein TerB n=1 Tax=Arenicella xantha TaxID=644221 RepID=A0A395JQI9_9GAMM|nr:TerB family tellurite resistance protein [Arenicella xantha]RBP51744.1 tellurite resistance protein TerB [Arenicella xantha]